MSKRIFISLLSGLIVLALCAGATRSYAAENVDRSKPKSLNKTTLNDIYTEFTINNLFNFYSNTGDGSVNPVTGQSGFEFPKGSGKTATFEDGIVWGGFHKGRLVGGVPTPKVGGSTYHRGLQAGAILTPGGALESQPPVADDPTLPKYHPYKVRPDVTPSTPFANVKDKLDAEAALIARYYSVSSQSLYDQYVADWNEWPAKDGAPAPYTDVNHDGKYDPKVDIPGADQTIYYVANDCNNNLAQSLYGSPTIGLEMHRTIWGYNQSGSLGNTVFESSLIINKSGASLDSAFFVQWADVDLGDAGDDYAGCDVARNLGYTYNGKAIDATYGKAVPATGYVFFQGPVIQSGNPADTAIFRLHKISGAKNLAMTTFVFFINSNATYTDPVFGTGGDVQWYRLMNGLISGTGGAFINPLTNQPSKFTLDGDPVAGTGWLDGTFGLVPGDRRQCSVTGPFTLANGDTQEVVVAHLVGLGNDRISSVAVMKWYSDLAQNNYNSLFNIPSPPPTPRPVLVDSLDGQVGLTWVDTTITGVRIETFNSGGYKFEGYNVYQFPTPSADLNGAFRVATYDIIDAITTIFDDVYDASTGYVINKPVEFGTDSGVKRSFLTSTDAVKSGAPLANGSPYYFGVTSYSYNAGAKPTHLESAPDLITVTPHGTNPGQRLNASPNQAVTPTHSAGISTATVSVNVVDPTRVLPDDYQIDVVVTDSIFNNDLGMNVANPRWQLTNKTTGKLVMYPSLDFSTINEAQIREGIKVGIVGAPYYTYGKELGKRTWTGPTDYNFTRVNPGSGVAGDISEHDGIYVGNDFFGIGLLNPPDVHSSIAVEFTKPGQGQNAYDFLRSPGLGSTTSKFIGYFPQPFKVWELNLDGSHKRQIDWVFMEASDFSAPSRYDSVWAPGPSASNREYWFAVAETYSASAKAKYAGTTLGSLLALDSVVWSGWMTIADETLPIYQDGDVWTLTATNIVTAQDKWTFSTKALAPTGSLAVAQADVAKVNVFPNPYIGFNPLERDKYNRFVTFSHLPQSATIRIFNLAGVLVRTLMKNSPDQFLQWDLRNESGFPVAAGMYIVYVDMGAIGTKTLKLGVIPEQQYIDRW
jgi:hypothetical protein